MVLGGGWVGELLPQVVLGHFAAGDAVQEGLRFRAFEDLGLADVVDGGWKVLLLLHLVEVQHFVEEFVLLLLVEHAGVRVIFLWEDLEVAFGVLVRRIAVWVASSTLLVSFMAGVVDLDDSLDAALVDVVIDVDVVMIVEVFSASASAESFLTETTTSGEVLSDE